MAKGNSGDSPVISKKNVRPKTLAEIDRRLTGTVEKVKKANAALAESETPEGGFRTRKEEELARAIQKKAQKDLRDAENEAQRLFNEKAKILARQQSEEAKVAALRSEKAVEAYASQFKQFSKSEAWGYQNEKWTAWAGTLTKTEMSAVVSYSGSGYDQLNKYLRGLSPNLPPTATKTLETKAKRIDKALLKGGKTTEDIFLRRDFSLTPLYEHMKTYGTLNGTLIQDRGFVSASLNKDWSWSGGFRANILLPKGSQGAYIRGISHHQSEMEFVLPRKTKFKIIKTEPDGSGHTRITMVAYTPNHPKYKSIKADIG